MPYDYKCQDNRKITSLISVRYKAMDMSIDIYIYDIYNFIYTRGKHRL